MKEMKPMLAATVKDVHTLRYPLLASAKLDGVRAFVENGVLLSRSRKPIPNLHCQRVFKEFEYFDGELIVGSPTAKDVYRETVSGVMSRDGEPHVKYMVFDHLQFPGNSFNSRRAKLFYEDGVNPLSQTYIRNSEELIQYEEEALSMGYEGVILRNPLGTYKFGRSTLSEQGMLKLKRFEDSEGVIVGFDELMHNGNPETRNELGYAEHSSHKANLVGRGTLGALRVLWHSLEFGIGTGFSDAMRDEIWKNREKYSGKIAKFKYLPIGVKDKPRHPVFLGWRSPVDL